VYSKNNNFKLKGLKILTELDGCNYSALSEDNQDKILDFVIDLIIIEERVNDKFDPIDLFIRLNYKPYPIKNNSFEMWNSIVNYDVIKLIKTLKTKTKEDNWFFVRETKDGKPDRMLNEELLIILSYICYNHKYNPSDEIIGFFLRNDRITCRLKDKKAMNDFLINLDGNEILKNNFMSSISKTNDMIDRFGELFGDDLSKDKINIYLNVKNSKTFRRSLQDFYLIWLILDDISDQSFKLKGAQILDDIRLLLSKLKNSDDATVNEEYLSNFNEKFDNLKIKYV
ncbi:MAG: hypothetical protein JKX68_14065, partial [Flavobacteriales bacterium]|nr:hypothetical protein [Flavobacteriales bacterium]